MKMPEREPLSTLEPLSRDCATCRAERKQLRANIAEQAERIRNLSRLKNAKAGALRG